MFGSAATVRVSRRRRAARFGWRLKQHADVVSREFRDDQLERTAVTLMHMWWNSGIRESQFVELLQQARDITKLQISAGQVTSGQPGHRHAIPYCIAVLRSLLESKATDG